MNKKISKALTGLLSLCLVFGFNFLSPLNIYASGQTWGFGYTGNYQTWTAPVTGEYKLEAWGGEGGTNQASFTTGGEGGYTSGTINLTAGQVIYVFVGGKGSVHGGDYCYGAGGWNGGGDGGGCGGGGGGATDFRMNGTDWSNRIMVAGGGGGGDHQGFYDLYWMRGGESDPNNLINSPQAYTAYSTHAGGGGGYQAGSGNLGNSWGTDGGGGGGSSYTGGVQQGYIQVGGHTGDGYAQITQLNSPPNISISSPSNGQQFSPGSTMTLSGAINDPDARGTMYVKYNIDGGSAVTASTLADTSYNQNYSYNIYLPGTMSIGNHTLNVWGEDSEGGVSSTQSLTFSVKDTVPPTLTVTGNPSSWTNQNVTLTATASDNVSLYGIKLPNGNWVQSSSASYVVSSNGSYTFVAQDSVGNQTTQTINVTHIDQDAPSINILDKRLENGLTGNVVFDGNAITNKITGKTYSLNQAQGGATFVSTPYGAGLKFNGGQIKIPTSDLGISDSSTSAVTVSYVINYSGENSVMPIGFFYYDNWITNGNFGFNTGQGDVYGISVPNTISNQYGIVTLVFNKGDYSNNSIYINGVKQSSLTTRQGNPEYLPATVFGNYLNINCWGSDYNYLMHSSSMGNVLIWNKALTDQEVTALYNHETLSGWTNQDINFDVYASDYSGIQNIVLPDLSTVYSSSATFKATQNGTYQVKATDLAGNQSVKTITVSNIDKNAPSLDVTPSTTSWINGNVTLMATASDGQSGLKMIQLPNGNWVNASSATYTVSSNGSYSFVALDNAGNTSAKTITVSNIDTTAPISPTINTNSAWVNTPVSVTIQSGSDSQSGISKTEYNLSGATTQGWTTYSQPFTISNEGITTISARTIDNVGLISNINTTTVHIDKTAPINGSITIVPKK